MENSDIKNLTVIVMAAGEGKRMCSDIPKVLHKFHGVSMLIRILLEINKICPTKIIIITGKYDLLIKKTIKDYYENNDVLVDLYDRLIFIQQPIPNGTGGAIKCTLDSLNDNESVLILNGDMPLVSSTLIERFIKNKSSAKLMISSLENPYGYGRILFDELGNFICIREDKECNEEERRINTINVGIYLFDSKILKTYIPLIDNNNAQHEYYLTCIVKLINNVNIDVYMIEDDLKYQINGVNTKDELILLESKCI